MNEQGYQSTLTGAQIQERLNLVPEHTAAIAAIQEAIKAFVNSEQVQTLINTALQPYSTTTEMNTAIRDAITSALTAYYTKTATDTLLANKVDKVNGKQLSTEDFTTTLKNKLNALPTATDLATQIQTAISTALESYYTKTETDTKLANKQDTISDLATIRSKANAAAPQSTTYTKTQTDNLLAPKQTAEQVSSAIATALTSYYTKVQMDTIITGITNNILFLNRALGKYDTVTERTLAQAIAGKYVNVNGKDVSASGYGISEPIVIHAGDILLVPSAQAVPADVSVVARKITRTYDKVITYTYTTDEETGHYLTATADYDPTLIYSAIYDGEGVFLYWIYNGVHYEQLPTTHEVTESMYEPLMKQAVSAMPSTGYYVYLCPVGMTVVISGLTATVSGGKALVMGLGIFKNVATNFIGAPGQAVIAQAFAQLLGDIQGIIENLKHMGSVKATDIDCENMPKVCGYPLVVEGAGAPSIVPRFVGQRYHDTTNNKCYEAFAVTNSTANWVLLN